MASAGGVSLSPPTCTHTWALCFFVLLALLFMSAEVLSQHAGKHERSALIQRIDQTLQVPRTVPARLASASASGEQTKDGQLTHAKVMEMLPWLKIMMKNTTAKQVLSTKPIICLRNVENNPRSASLFESGRLNHHKPRFWYMMTHHAKVLKVHCNHTVLLVEYNINNKKRLTSTAEQMSMCSSTTPCIITGDEICSYRPDSKYKPFVVGRFYYSSDYTELPVFSLGPIIGFNVGPKDWAPPSHSRKYMYNFVGSRGVNAQKRDREELFEVLDAAQIDAPAFVNITPRFKVEVKQDNETEADLIKQYRNTLLNSSFTLDPIGDHDECFRFWEAIAAGSIPIFVKRRWGLRRLPQSELNKRPHKFHGGRGKYDDDLVMKESEYPYLCPDAFDNILTLNPPIVVLDSWDELPHFFRTVNEAKIVRMRYQLKKWNSQYWKSQTDMADNIMEKAFPSLKGAK